MRLFTTFLISTALLLPFEIDAQSNFNYEVEKVAEGVYVLKPQLNELRWVTSNIVIIINEFDVLVVDSGLLPSAGEEAILELKKLTNKPVKFLVNTHWHGDHWQGNEAFVKNYPGVEIIASVEGYNGIARNGMVWVRQFYTKYWSGYIEEFEEAIKTGTSSDGKKLSTDTLKLITDGLADMRGDLEELKEVKPKLPTLTFSEKLILYSGKRQIQIHYLGWGNTTGDAIVYLPHEKLLITGDLVVYPSPYESASFSREWLETSKKLKDFEFNHLIPGHGEVQHDTHYLDYLNTLFSEIILQMNGAFLNGKNNLEAFSAVVTHKSVTDALTKKNPEYTKYLKNLDPAFVPAAIRSSFQKAKEGKL